jgi:hypothetical protein
LITILQGKCLFMGAHALPASYSCVSLGFVMGRPRFNIRMNGRADKIHFNNPTAVALAGLCALIVSSPKFVNGFIGAGGLPALVHLLQNATCPLILAYTFLLIDKLLGGGMNGTPSLCSEIGAQFLLSGE